MKVVDELHSSRQMSLLGQTACETLDRMLVELFTSKELTSPGKGEGTRAELDGLRVIARYLSDGAVFEDAVYHYMTHIGERFPFAIRLEEFFGRLERAWPRQENLARANTLLTGACREICDRSEEWFNTQLFNCTMFAKPLRKRVWMQRRARQRLNTRIEAGVRLLSFVDNGNEKTDGNCASSEQAHKSEKKGMDI